MLPIERRRPSRLTELCINLLRSPVNQNGFLLPADLLHPLLCCADVAFQRLSLIERGLNPVLKLGIGADLILFQIDHRACQHIDVVSFRPAFIAFALAGAQLCFNVNQALDLAFRHPASGTLGDMHMLSGK